jgi:hypothetical protein
MITLRSKTTPMTLHYTKIQPGLTTTTLGIKMTSTKTTNTKTMLTQITKRQTTNITFKPIRIKPMLIQILSGIRIRMPKIIPTSTKTNNPTMNNLPTITNKASATRISNLFLASKL